METKKLNLEEGIDKMTEKRNFLLGELSNRIKSFLGTEEELIKDLKELVKFNQSLGLLVTASKELDDVTKYFKEEENRKQILLKLNNDSI